MITVEQHLAAILAAVRPLDQQTVALTEALGRTLREDVRAAVDLPLWDNSAMDGFAVRFADVAHAGAASPAVLRVVADLPAGSALDPALGPGEAARIMTGAPIPADADTVVPFESTAGGLAGSLASIEVVQAPARRGAHIRRRAEDRVVGDVVVPAGAELGPLQLSAIAAANVPTVAVSRRPRIAVIATGSELVPPGGELPRGAIPESNSLLLASLAREVGADVVLRATVGDVDHQLRAVLTDATSRGADALITSGGVSAGAYEVVKSTLTEMTFSQVAMQPGRPQGFATGPPLIFGLPGNPVSAAVSFEVFARPALLAMQGRAAVHRRMLRLRVATGWQSSPGRRRYVPVVLIGEGVAPAAAHGAHRAGALGRAEGFAVIAEDRGDVRAGDLVDVLLMS